MNSLRTPQEGGPSSVPEASVVVNCELSGDASNLVRFAWREQNGPTDSEPHRIGFGMTFLQRALPLEINGRTSASFLDGGACIVIEGTLPQAPVAAPRMPAGMTAHRAWDNPPAYRIIKGGEMTCQTSRRELERMAAVRRYDILDTPPDGAFDRITRMASRLFNVPIAIVSIVDQDRIWFKSHHGLDATEIPRSPGLCASAILDNRPWVLSDAKYDPRSLANPLVAGEFGLRFYAGVPLRTYDGFNLGTLCVIDKEPREVDEIELAHLEDLAAVVMDEIELRRSARTAVEEKEILFREVHHRVKNNLQIVSSLITLQNRLMPPESRHHFEECLRRIQSMAGLHEKFYRGRQVETINLLEYLSEMAASIIATFGLTQRVTAEIQGQAVEVDLEMGTPLALLAAEVISNACKHGFPNHRTGRISIDVVEQEGKLRLTISDDGVGLPDGDPQTEKPGIGQKLIANFVQRLEGTSRFTSEGNGTRFEMFCPLIRGGRQSQG